MKVLIKNNGKTPFYGVVGRVYYPGKEYVDNLSKIQLARISAVKWMNIKDFSKVEVPEQDVKVVDIDLNYNSELSENLSLEVEESEKELTEDQEIFKCEKCGKEYEREIFYKRHVEKCDVE